MRGNGKTDSTGEAGGAPVRDNGGGGGRKGLSDRWLAFIVAAVVVALDQLSKAWALRALAEGDIVIIDGFLRLRLTSNTGAAFSLFQNSGPLIGIIAVGVVVLIFIVLGDASRRVEAIALGMVLGGAVGNLVDRAFRGDGFLDGAVIDWIGWWWIPTFNVADAAITSGVALLLLATVIRR